MPRGEHGIAGWLHALARLAVAGVAVDTAALHTGRDSDPARWEDPPQAPGWVVNGHFARTAGGDPLPKGLRPAHAAPVLSLGNGHHDPTAAPQRVAGGPAACPTASWRWSPSTCGSSRAWWPPAARSSAVQAAEGRA